ncbi:MAG: hypothetical protein JST54_35705 [Deltaproteobacteria bacterium]|nr:hypothetical protein [Deltaproteobacteria bacterium]
MTIDVADLAKRMLAVAIPELGNGASAVEHFAQMEMTKLAQTAAGIEAAAAAGTVTEEIAASLLQMQKCAAQSVLTTAEGLGLVAVEKAINAALGILKAALNTALGWRLL